jgi:1-acyl-sn-glycerol-3-phosphate acyltransferase
MQGYFRDPEATAAITRGDGWMDSGDLGYCADGDLFITGRAKDVIIAAGRNIYPQEVEEAVGDVAGVRRGCVAAFGVEDRRSGTERLVVVAESRQQTADARNVIRDAIIARLVDAIGIPPDEVVVAAPGTIPKSSSGKIRRSATKQSFVSGTLGRGRASVVWQWTRLASGAVVWRARRALTWLGSLLYTAWVVAWVLLVTPIVWAAVASTADARTARRVIRAGCRALLAAGGARPNVRSLEPGALETAAVLVANHASYLDVVVLLATLPVNVRLAAKARLASYPVLGTIIRRAGYLQVERGRPTAARDLVATLTNGESLFVFPEGTFVRVPGVMPFRLGAFHAAVETRTPILPIALAGTRAFFPDERWLLTHGPLEVVVGKPLFPEATEWSEIVRLRDAARHWIARECGEPMIDRGATIIAG